jgi:GR25 family glycosyltransferase involved in LPS biosynthesis
MILIGLIGILIVLIIMAWLLRNIETYQNYTTIPFYVINLDSSVKRLKSMEEQCQLANINMVRFPAVNGSLLKLDDIKERVSKNSYMYKNIERNKGELGCALSHMNIWRDNSMGTIATNDMFIVVEDDVIIPTNFQEKLKKYMDNAPPDWDVIYLGGSNIRGSKVNDSFIRPKLGMKGNLGTYAMLVNRDGCTKLIAQTTPLRKSIDHQLKEEFNKSLKVYYVNPPLITHNNNLDSDRRILNKTSSKPSLKWRSYKQNNVEIMAE